MSKWVTFVYPGQGSQYQGMGLSLISMDPAYRELASQASDILGYDVVDKLTNATDEELSQTIFTQPLIYFINYLSHRCLIDHDIRPHYVAGHSLGEISAITAAEVINFEVGLKLVKKRAELMQEATEKFPGKMLAILGMEETTINDILSKMNITGVLNVANYNCPGQTVLSGSVNNIDLAELVFKERGARKIIPLKVSGGFHSSLMAEASKKFSLEIDKYDFREPKYPVVPNRTAEIANTADEVRKALTAQMTNSVLWTLSIDRLISIGVNIFVEVGPSSVLCGLIRKIHKEIEVYNVEDEKTLYAVLHNLPVNG